MLAESIEKAHFEESQTILKLYVYFNINLSEFVLPPKAGGHSMWTPFLIGVHVRLHLKETTQ